MARVGIYSGLSCVRHVKCMTSARMSWRTYLVAAGGDPVGAAREPCSFAWWK